MKEPQTVGEWFLLVGYFFMWSLKLAARLCLTALFVIFTCYGGLVIYIAVTLLSQSQETTFAWFCAFMGSCLIAVNLFTIRYIVWDQKLDPLTF